MSVPAHFTSGRQEEWQEVLATAPAQHFAVARFETIGAVRSVIYYDS